MRKTDTETMRGNASWARCEWADALLHLDDEDQEREIRQFLLDALDLVNQQDLEPRVIAALKAFDEGK